MPNDFQSTAEAIKPLLARMEGGDEQAATQILRLLAPRMRQVIRKHLDRRVRRFEDSDDVLQNALLAAARFFQKKAGYADEYQFLAMVLAAARKQTARVNRHHLGVGKRADAAFEKISELETWFPGGSSASGPVDEAIAQETLRTLLLLPEPVGTIIDLRRRGWSVAMIGVALDLDDREVRRLLEGASHLFALDREGVTPAIPGAPELSELAPRIAEEVMKAFPTDYYRVLVLLRAGMPPAQARFRAGAALSSPARAAREGWFGPNECRSWGADSAPAGAGTPAGEVAGLPFAAVVFSSGGTRVI